MAKTDFRVIDISMKITNQLPMIRITEDLVVTVNNRKSTILNIQAMAQEAENKENKDDMGVFGQMSNAMGITGQAALDMAEDVTGLTGDVASFYNLGTDEAYTKLKSIWTGETETLKDLGVVMTQTNLDQYALNNGFGKTTAKMTEQEKVMLRYQYVTSALSNATGDFVKTQDSWANQTRILTLRFEQLKASFGKGFIALFTPILRGLNSALAGLQKVADGFATFTQMLKVCK